MQEATFCDWLINRGVEFHPDTVIVDVSHFDTSDTSGFLRQLELDALKNRLDYEKSVPVFSYMFFETWGQITGVGKIYMGTLIEKQPSGYYAVYFVTQTPERNIAIGPTFGTMWFNEYGMVDWDVDEGIIYDNDYDYAPITSPFGEIKPGFKYEIVTEALAVGVLELTRMYLYPFHQQHEIELVDQPRPKARRILRQTKKLPSPYFRILDASDKPQKRYAGSGVLTGRKLDKAHIVRGHFRHTQDHPIAQFNGTFWIPSHMKGKGENAPPPRYKIVLRGE